MTNLVPLHIDKDTGELVATPISSGTPLAQGHLHTQTTPATVWVINHGRNTDQVLVQVYDADRELVIPDVIRVFNLTTVRVEFASPQDGFAHLVFFKV